MIRQRVVRVRSPGPAGPGATVTVGTVTTGEPGSEAAVTDVGTPGAAVLNFVIPQGIAGNTVLYGPGVPADEDGVDGNFYIDTAAHAIYGPKAAGAWPAGTSLIGPQGIAGNTVLYGDGVPSDADGVDGNFYIDTTAHAIYGPKAAGAWPAGASLIGPQGSPGPLAAAVTSDDVTGATYTVVVTDLGKRKRFTNASGCAVTLPNSLAQGFSIICCQVSAAQVSFAAASGATLNNRVALNKTAGQWSEVSLTVDTNSDGAHAVWVLSGDVGP